jgi:hypothetical protein
MKTAALIAFISSVLELLMQLVFLVIDVFHFEIDNIRYLGIGSRCLLILFTASLCYYFFASYKRRAASARPAPKTPAASK